ncbi:N-formylglutamate amidohydrolase [Sphingobium algorifonticola]|uniref:N-formylglutamate amidohydrolase n=1 Tax=Sphingobium algorifonticola TaxID=2008318 RepID=A0A437J6M6_9SPHN|nr:N-formylglutamate amidohydrolase [Sphingobium algorifonticola]RVT40828.1 N-formylglutamate amidohydrolase [Sphingobium algorifonticola]
MTVPFTLIPARDSDVLIVADHASAHVPDDIDLGIDPALMDSHIAIDIGVAQVARMLCARLGCGAILGGASRLVIDLNREEDAPGLIPLESDGHVIAGNAGVDRQARIDRFYRPYHAAVTQALDGMARPFILSLHSFTPALSSRDEDRPWHVGVLYNRDDRAARIAIPMLARAGLHVGDQLPYSGTILNATMNRHAEARGIPYLGVEMRQDLTGDASGQARFVDYLAPVIEACRNALA